MDIIFIHYIINSYIHEVYPFSNTEFVHAKNVIHTII